MRLVCFSDTHGRHARLTVPDGDVLVFAGDACEVGTPDELRVFLAWFAALPHPTKVFVAGNHDWPLDPRQATADDARALVEATGARVLQDEAVEVGGFTVYGSPWQPAFHDWAFNLPRGGRELEAAWARIPDATDVLVTHSPPYGRLDQSYAGVPCGCELLAARVAEVQPRLHVFGHIHEAAGVLDVTDLPTTFANVSAVDLLYRPVYPPQVFDLD